MEAVFFALAGPHKGESFALRLDKLEQSAEFVISRKKYDNSGAGQRGIHLTGDREGALRSRHMLLQLTHPALNPPLSVGCARICHPRFRQGQRPTSQKQ